MTPNYPTTTHYFPNIIADKAVYVDKTAFILPLIAYQSQSNYFLSRPRRFGKSLFVSTLEQVFLGNKKLFKGLHIYDKIKWQKHPVIRLSMDKIGFAEKGLEKSLYDTLKDLAKEHQITLENDLLGRQFAELITKLSKINKNNVVILIDEYDKPIIHYIEKNDTAQAELNRDILKSFYGILKDNGEFLRFVFITGVSKFAKVSIFSDLNYFKDLTLDTRFATVCGFTETELKQYFQNGLQALADKEKTSVDLTIAKIRHWYDGFSWNGEDFVYNPFSTMHLMDSLTFKNYWFESGTPTLLLKLIEQDSKYIFKDTIVEESIYDWHDLKNLDYLSLMLQTGYLTFKKSLGNFFYNVDYPNKEVEVSFSKLLLGSYKREHPATASKTVFDIENALKANQLTVVMGILTDMFKTLPSYFFTEPRTQQDAQGQDRVIYRDVGESFYHAIIYLIFKILGLHIAAEVTAQKGRIDALIETPDNIYIFEFKKDREPKAALDQIKSKQYDALFALSKKRIYAIGVGFSESAKGISNYDIEQLINGQWVKEETNNPA